MATVLGWLASFLPILWWLAARGLPKLIPALMSMIGKKGILASLAGVIIGIYNLVKRIPKFLAAIAAGTGVLGSLFRVISWIYHFMFKFPIIAGLTLVIGNIFPTIWERIFLVVGAVAVKFGVMIFGGFVRMITASTENNIDGLRDAMGESAKMLPPCMVDVLGYLHVIENIGMIISTIVLIATYNLVKAFAGRFVK